MDTPRKPSRRVLVAAIAAGVLTSTVAVSAGSAQAYPPGGDQALEVVFLDPVCELDAPYVAFELSPVGFESTGPASLTIRDLDGNVVDSLEFAGLSGSFLYPGASVDDDGNATDWPGWVSVDGTWVEDPSDARLRDGLNVTFNVNPSVTQFVAYPAADSGCAGPAGVSAFGSTTPTQASLPSTGSSGVSTTLLAAGLALLLGLALTTWNVVSNRRRSATETSLS